MNLKYAVIIEKGKTGYGAYVPDLPGCIAVAKTRVKVERLMREAIAEHIEVLRQTGRHVPEPQADDREAGTVTVVANWVK